MYGENKILKIFSLVAFVAFAAVSCWSTTESLFLSLEHAEIPKWVFWIADVGLYVLTSYCFKMMIDSFDQNVYMEHRTLKFVVGLLGVLLLWIAFSMPTNTHTFFYKQMAKDVAVKELTHVDAELLKLSSENAFHETYNAEWHAYETKVLGGLAAIKAEIADYQNIGMGDKAEARVAEVEDLLGVKTKTIARLKPLNHSQKEINKVCEHYDGLVKDLLAVKKQQHDANVARAYEDFRMKMRNVGPLRAQIDETLKQLNDDQYDKEAVLKNARKLAAQAYAELESQFNGLYTYDEGVYRSERLVNVTKVWGDYMSGKFRNTNYTLWYWILLSVIVDIAAFAFFDIAFKREDYV
jgi:hypothetical protein